jgi:hypothetical protein
VFAYWSGWFSDDAYAGSMKSDNQLCVCPVLAPQSSTSCTSRRRVSLYIFGAIPANSIATSSSRPTSTPVIAGSPNLYEAQSSIPYPHARGIGSEAPSADGETPFVECLSSPPLLFRSFVHFISSLSDMVQLADQPSLR